MSITVPLSGLWTAQDVFDRMGDGGLAVGDTDTAKVTEVAERKLLLAHEDLQLDLIGHIQRTLAPYQENHLWQAPETILTKLHNPTLLKKVGVYYTICLMLEEGELLMRFKFAEAGDEISKANNRFEKRRKEAYDAMWSQLLFDTDGNGTITTLERMFTNPATSSVRVSV
jgi:hypothetical protein